MLDNVQLSTGLFYKRNVSAVSSNLVFRKLFVILEAYRHRGKYILMKISGDCWEPNRFLLNIRLHANN
jgi:hypothetical protein